MLQCVAVCCSVLQCVAVVVYQGLEGDIRGKEALKSLEEATRNLA